MSDGDMGDCDDEFYCICGHSAEAHAKFIELLCEKCTECVLCYCDSLKLYREGCQCEAGGQN